MMDFRQLEVFVATVDHRSFSVAAETLYLSQPTVSSYIHALEKELNTQLIRRTTKRFEVTASGQQLYEYAVAMLRLQKKAVHELSKSGVRELLIGTSSVPGRCILPKVLAGYCTAAPETSFHVTHSNSMDIIHKVMAGTLDVGLVGMKTEGDCVFEPIATDELVIVTPNNAYFRERYLPNGSLRELLREPFIMRAEESGTKWEARQLLNGMGLSEEELQVAVYVNDAAALQNYVVQGMGISVVSRRMVEADEQQGKLLVFPVEEYALPRNFYLVFREGPYLSKAASAFIRYLRELSRDKKL